ncbi:MAG: paraslipin [Proteobacteria bacterium]|nr:MAG: paraslipin [Pseudomonadota bacterium]
MGLDVSVLLIAIAIVVGIIIILGVKVVSQSDVWVIERLGKFHRTLHGGFHIIIPIIDQVRSKLTVREGLIDIPRQSVITKDNVNIAIDGIVYVKVEDGRDATYNVIDFERAITNLAMTTLRGEIGGMVLDDTLSSRDKLNARLQADLGAAADNWGIKIMRVEVSEISVPATIEEAMNMQMKAEREKRAIELKAMADKEALIRKAEALKQEKVLEAEAIERMADAKKYEQEVVATGEKNAMEMINIAINENPKSAEFLLAKDRIKAFNELAKNQNSQKVVIPYEVSELIGSLSVLKDFMSSKKA